MAMMHSDYCYYFDADYNNSGPDVASVVDRDRGNQGDRNESRAAAIGTVVVAASCDVHDCADDNSVAVAAAVAADYTFGDFVLVVVPKIVAAAVTQMTLAIVPSRFLQLVVVDNVYDYHCPRLHRN
jgi:hypothetical protein